MKKIKRGKGSAIFLHLTKNYKPTAGCIAIKKKDFEILIKIIKKNTFIKIYLIYFSKNFCTNSQKS